MPRFLLLTTACVLVLGNAQAQDPGRQATVAYIHTLQADNGGFKADSTDKNGPSLRSTTSAVRGAPSFRRSSRQPAGMSTICRRLPRWPNRRLRGRTQGQNRRGLDSIGLMAIKALGMPAGKYGPGANKYLTEQVVSFEDIRIAAAGLESIDAKSSKNQAWLDMVLKMRGSDGTFGAGLARLVPPAARS